MISIPHTLLAVDPAYGKRSHAGAALFRDGLLERAAVISPPKDGDISERCAITAQRITEWACIAGPCVLAVEWPQHYPTGRNIGNPNDLLPLAGVCTAVTAYYYQHGGCRVHSYKPKEWSGGLPKSKKKGTGVRRSRIMDRLTEAELAVMPDQHDVIDAVGIGLHHLGRLKPKRVHAGATK